MEKKQQISIGDSSETFKRDSSETFAGNPANKGKSSENDLQEKFVRLVRDHKSTIYTVCYMFSKDNDEVNDLFQEILVNLWRGFPKFEGAVTFALGFIE